MENLEETSQSFREYMENMFSFCSVLSLLHHTSKFDEEYPF